MLLSDLIKKLEQIQQERGNLHVGHYVPKCGLPNDPLVFDGFRGVNVIKQKVPGFARETVDVLILRLY